MMTERPDALSILFVIDDVSVCEALESLLGSVGLQVERFSSPSEFPASASPDVPSCLVLDVRLLASRERRKVRSSAIPATLLMQGLLGGKPKMLLYSPQTRYPSSMLCVRPELSTCAGLRLETR